MAVDVAKLNLEQREAVLHTEGPLLVLAGAGSGKTRVITYRLAYLIEQGISARSILSVTFTNKAAYEMKQRARALAGKSVRGATISTFHSLGARILREYPDRVGLKKGFTISDGSEQLGFFRRILRDLRIDDRHFDPKTLMSMISMAKNAGLDAAMYRAQRGHLVPTPEGPLEPVPEGAPDEEYVVAAIEAYDRYEVGLKAQNVVDFDDLLLLTLRLLATCPDILEALRARWRYLMIDEFQDTNGAQLDLMRTLAGERQNVCAVGDDDQSIYGWRGADIQNILGFDRHFPGAKIVKLELNYRSTGCILETANEIIKQNSGRHDKTLKPFAGPGQPVRVCMLEDEEQEAEQVSEAVEGLLAQGAAPKDIAVLFRSNVQSRPIELAFRSAHIAYRVAGGMELFDRREVKDMIAYLRMLDNPDDEQSLRRVINYPPRGIGDTTLTRIDDWSRSLQLTLQEGLARVYDVPNVSERAADAVTSFVELMDDHRKQLKRRKVSTVVAGLVEAIGFEDVLFGSSDNAATASRRVDNVRELVRQVERFESRVKRVKRSGEDEDLFGDAPSASLSGFLADMALGSRDDGNKKEDREDQVLLSTIHAAKGLEWTHVFLVGAEEDLLPHKKIIDEGGQVEEERRLAYVAVTRAREQLTVSWAKTRTKYGRMVERTRSRFFEELSEDYVHYIDDQVSAPKSEDERDAIAQHHLSAIREMLGER